MDSISDDATASMEGGSSQKRPRQAATQDVASSSATPSAEPRVWRTMNSKPFSSADELVKHLTNTKAKAKAGHYWHKLRVVKVEDDVKVQCIECEAMMSSTNVPARGSSHFVVEAGVARCMKVFDEGASSPPWLFGCSIDSLRLTAGEL